MIAPRTLNAPSSLWAGESHMDLMQVLRRRGRWIQRTTPELSGESDGRIREDRPGVAGYAGRERATRVVGNPVHCACGGPAWGHDCLLYTSPSPRDGLLSRM